MDVGVAGGLVNPPYQEDSMLLRERSPLLHLRFVDVAEAGLIPFVRKDAIDSLGAIFGRAARGG